MKLEIEQAANGYILRQINTPGDGCFLYTTTYVFQALEALLTQIVTLLPGGPTRPLISIVELREQ